MRTPGSKLIIAAILTIATTQSHRVTAQDSTSRIRKIHYAIDFGITLSFFDRKTAPYFEPNPFDEFKRTDKQSVEFGGSVNFPLSKVITFSTGLRYAGRGGSYRAKNANYVWVVNYSTKEDAYNYLNYRLVYIEAPVLFKFKVSRHFSLYGGVTGMYNIGSKLRYNVFSDDEEEWKRRDIKGAKKTVLCSVAGVEWETNGLPKTGEKIGFYIRYSGNLTDLYDASEPGSESFNLDMFTISTGFFVKF